MPKKSKRSVVTKPMQDEIKHGLSNEQLSKLLDDLETLYKNVQLGSATLTVEEESKYIIDYLKSLVLSKPEAAASEKLLKPIMQEAGIENFPEGRVGGGWVDFILPSSREIGPPVALELKPLHGRDGKLNPLSKEFDLLKEQAHDTNTNQVIRYITGGNEGKGVNYIVLTNLQDVYIFDKGCIFEFEPAKRESFREFMEAISVTKNIPDYLRRTTEEIRKRDLDKYFFNDLKNWFGQLQKLDWREGPQVNSVLLLNKLIFALTLEDFEIIDYRKTWDIFSRNFTEWSAKGPKEVVENFFGQLDKFLYKYYDTELFIPSNNILLKLKDSDESYAGLLRVLRSVGGFVSEMMTDSRGLYVYNFRLINEDVFGKAYETYLAENRKESGIYYTPNQITGKMASDLVQHLFGETRDKLIQDLNSEEYDDALILANRLVKITIFDPACGSGAFLISILREIVKVYSDIKPKTEWIDQLGLKEISEPEIERISKVKELREVLGFNGQMKGIDRVLLSKIILRHIYGCDLDSMALNVAKVNLWKETVKLNRDSFYFQSLPRSVNHILPNLKVNFVNGNSIVGLPDEFVIDFLKEKAKTEIVSLVKLRNEYLEDPTNADLAEEIEEMKKPLRVLLQQEFIKSYPDLENPLFYPLEFFFLYFDDKGEPLQNRTGVFSGLIGNPPWNNLKPIKKEFAHRHPEIFGEVSKYSISGKDFENLFEQRLKDKEVAELWKQYEEDTYSLSRFIRGHYKLQGKGDTSLQKTFVERFTQLSQNGFAVLVPSNFHTDEGAYELRREILQNWQLSELISFENRRGMWFPDLHPQFKFDMLFVSRERTGKPFKARFYVNDWSEVQTAFDYPVDLILKLSPEVMGITEFRAKEDIKITQKIRNNHKLLRKHGFIFSREFDEANDKDLFGKVESEHDVEVFEGKMIHQYNSVFSKNRYWINEQEGRERLMNSFIKSVTRRVHGEDSITQLLQDRKLLMDYEVERLVIRRQGRSTDERTLIASMVPARNFLIDNLSYMDPFSYKVKGESIEQIHDIDNSYYLLSLLNSFVLDYYIRQRVSANLNFFFLYELPIPDASGESKKRVISLAENLMKDPSNKQKRIELEVLIARDLFKLSKEDMGHILDSFVYGNIDKELTNLIIEKFEAEL